MTDPTAGFFQHRTNVARSADIATPGHDIMSGMRVRAVIAVAVAMCAVVACGTDEPGSGGTDQQQGSESPRAVIAASIRATGDSDPNGLKFSSEEAECAADAITAEIDVARLEELGLDMDEKTAPELTDPPLTTQEGDVVYGAFEACIDLRAQLGESFAADGSLDAQSAQCVADEYLASGLPREALLSQGFDAALNDRIDAALAAAFEACSS